MSGDLYHVLQGTISRSTLRDEVTSKNLSRSRFVKYFTNLSGNFGILFEGSSQILSVPWNDVIQYSHIVMFFGKQFNQLRPWGPVFWFKTDPEYAHHVFRSFALEYFGNSRALAQLFAAYKNCMCTIYCKRSLDAVSPSTSTRAKMPTFNFEQARAFQSSFNNMCRYSFLTCFSDFNDYSMPILLTSDFSMYLNASKHIFPEQWVFLLSHRNINRDRNGNDLTEFKECQVFISLLMLQRMAIFRCLPHWCLILSTAMYGWGTRIL